ncbi:MAG: tetratricopeptide repeat protein [Planctomycetes bacterium]|nr:tetratricopeptide repeat protein [Planctomycetota bacterium]
MFTSTSTANKVPTLPSVADNTKPPKATPDFHIAMAKQMESVGNLAGAEEQYHKALALDGNNLVALINLAHLCDRQKRMPEAEALYVKATKLHPSEAAAFNDLGLCYARQHKLAQSQTALAEAVRLEGDRKLYRNNLATVLVEINRPQEALQHLQAVQDESVAHYNLGYLLANKGENQLAEHHFRQALQIDPTLTAAQTWLDSLDGQPAMLSARASDSAAAADAVAIAEPSAGTPASGTHQPPETLTELSGGPHLHPGIHKLPPVDNAAPAPSRY